MTASFFTLVAVAWLSFSAATPTTPAAPTPPTASRDEVLRLVPEDFGFCLLVQDLRGHAQAFLNSPFLTHLAASPLGAKLLAAPEAPILKQAKANLESGLGIPLSQLRDDILGDAVVLAYRPGPVDKPAEEQGLLALRARDPILLTRLLDRINLLQEKSGDLKQLETREHRGVVYQRRVLAQGSNYCLVRGPFFVFATREALLREAIDRLQAGGAAEDSPLARQFRTLGLEDRLATLWINPRVFEPALRRRAEEVGVLRATALKTLLIYWQSLESVALSVRVHKDVELALTLRGRPERLPPAARRFLATACQPSELWQCFPPEAIFAVAGRFDVLAFSEMLAEFLPEQARAVMRAAFANGLGLLLSKEVLGKILPQLGPDWGVCVLEPQPEDKGCIPPLLVALRVSGNRTAAPPARELDSAVHGFVDLLVNAFNQLHAGTMGLRTVIQDKAEVKYLVEDSVFPPGFRPAFALKGGYLLLASSPEAIQRFPAALPRRNLPEAAEVPFVRFSPQALARFVKARRDSLAAYLALVHQLPRAEIERRLENLLGALQLLDGVEVVSRSAPEQLSLILRLRTVPHLR